MMISRLESLCRKDETEAWETEYEGKFTDVTGYQAPRLCLTLGFLGC